MVMNLLGLLILISLAVVSSLSRDVIFALAAFSSRFKSSFSIAELFFWFLYGGLGTGARWTAVEGRGTRDVWVLYLQEQKVPKREALRRRLVGSLVGRILWG